MGNGSKHACGFGLPSLANGNFAEPTTCWLDCPFRPWSQYASEQYQALLAKHGFVFSMSGRGNCWDNAVAERFFLNLKMERVWRRDYASQEEAKKDIADYIVSFYNASRINSVLGNMSSVAYEQKMAALAKKTIEVSEIS